MIAIKDCPPGAIVESRETLDGQLRVTRRKVLGQFDHQHESTRRFVATELLFAVQYRGVVEHADEIKWENGGPAPCWTDGLYPVEIVA